MTPARVEPMSWASPCSRSGSSTRRRSSSASPASSESRSANVTGAREGRLDRPTRLVRHRLDDGHHPDRVGDVVDEVHERQHRHQDQDGCDGDGVTGDEGRLVGRGPADRLQDDQRVHEGPHEDAQGHLGAPVAQERAEHARRELAAGELERHDRDREDQPGEAEHRGRDRREDGLCGRGAASERER